MAKGDTCRVCGGFGEAQVLANPTDPQDGSYILHQCPACAGSGLDPGEGWAKAQPDRGKALRLALEAIEKAFKRARAPGRTPSDPGD